jgi:hypothetical protein
MLIFKSSDCARDIIEIRTNNAGKNRERIKRVPVAIELNQAYKRVCPEKYPKINTKRDGQVRAMIERAQSKFWKMKKAVKTRYIARKFA